MEDDGIPSQFRRWILGGLFGAVAMLLPLGEAFTSADSLRSGMILEEVKAVPALQSKKVGHIFKIDKLDMFSIDRFNQIYFCHGRLVEYSKYISDVSLFQLATNGISYASLRIKNVESGFVNDGQT